MMNMKRLLSFSLLLLIFFSGNAQSDWEPLFNGKDLSGFTILNGKASYRVENGMIIGKTVYGEPNSFLATNKVYGDFILELDLRLKNPMNSGIQFRSEIKDANDTCAVGDKTPNRVHGYQMEIDPSPRAWSGGIYDEARRGWLYPMDYNPEAKSAFKKSDWNHYKIECIGNSIRTWINGIPCAHLIDAATAKGFIALQVHNISKKEEEGEEIQWKNIRIKTKNLKPAPSTGIFIVNSLANNVSLEEEKQGYRLLWDGVSSKGWRGAYKTDFPDKVWQIKDGTLTVNSKSGAESANGGDIVTEEKFGAFDLQFEFKISDTANSGVKYFVTETENNVGSAIGLEFQILDDDKHPDAKLGSIGNRTMGSLYDLIPAANLSEPGNGRRDKLPVGQWNRGRIIVYPNGHIEHWLNGFKIVSYDRGTPIFYALVARSKYAQWKNFGMAPTGRILLQEHGTVVSFRSIKIKTL